MSRPEPRYATTSLYLWPFSTNLGSPPTRATTPSSIHFQYVPTPTQIKPHLPTPTCMHLIARQKNTLLTLHRMALVRERRHQQTPLSLAIPHSPIHSADFSLPSPPSPGPATDRIFDFEKLTVLGHGTGGTVYKARHKRTKFLFAIKSIRRDAADAALRESDILVRAAESPFIVRLHDILPGDSSGDQCFFLVLEYMPRGSLRDVLTRHRRLPEPLIAAIATCVLQGLHHLHCLGIVHGDIKPSNLLVGGNGEVKIADFGASRLVGNIEDYGGEMVGGTCAYMSPERFDSEGFNGTSAAAALFAGDVWALGVVLLECHVGRFPLVAAGERPDWSTLMSAVCFRGAPELPGAATPEYRSFVGRCLEKDWRTRGTLVELLCHPFVVASSCSTAKGCLANADHEQDEI